MFNRYRIRKLKVAIDAKAALVERLEIVDKEYRCSYYTDQLNSSVCELAELKSKLRLLEA